MMMMIFFTIVLYNIQDAIYQIQSALICMGHTVHTYNRQIIFIRQMHNIYILMMMSIFIELLNILTQHGITNLK